MGKPPKYHEDLDSLILLGDRISSIQDKLSNYVRILSTPQVARDYYSKTKSKKFRLPEYILFYEAIGKYLGNLFEPLGFENRLHDIDFFDIEENDFVTSESKRIYVDWLSQGQNKKIALTPSLKRLGLSKPGIVLIDEVADLDYSNLAEIKQDLKQAYNEGKIILAIIVRPLQEQSQNIVEISSW